MDELIMNALFDAPCDEFGKTLYSSVSRTQNRNLNGRDTVSLILGFDGQSVVARVIDQYGSIDRQRLMQHVSVNYKDKDYMVKVGQAGAGLGLSTVFNSGSSLIYQCDVGQQTQVTLISKVFQGYREFKNQFKYLSVRFNA